MDVGCRVVVFNLGNVVVFGFMLVAFMDSVALVVVDVEVAGILSTAPVATVDFSVDVRLVTVAGVVLSLTFAVVKDLIVVETFSKDSLVVLVIVIFVSAEVFPVAS